MDLQIDNGHYIGIDHMCYYFILDRMDNNEHYGYVGREFGTPYWNIFTRTSKEGLKQYQFTQLRNPDGSAVRVNTPEEAPFTLFVHLI